ncbi:LysR family transcriptional regulator [Arthrobacter sp. W4I7]|uniref:LysR family transcriptional regulator n=1 Tax=Arthrobacter sp. W4I7 TaxID=3042296 RepID=UPI00277FEE57|nr:LysR family transcriptional regulator [Arthrobacter sp. W4I7]MDQ0691169.1 DNA-binding transcriptional LysR family regulator [Arthrobacter sp. W4I7]
MNLRRLEYFLAVVDAGTITAAAELIHIAQPALSRQIKTLEKEFKLSLFEAQGNKLVLTPAGRAFVPAARRLILETQTLEDAADALRTGRVATLVVAATAASVRGFLAPYIATTGPEDPLIITRETSHFAITDALLHGSDFAVSPAAPESGLATMPLGSIPLTAYVAADHPWALEGVSELPLSALASQHAILPSHQSVSRYLLDDALNQAHLSFRQVSECDDGQTIMALAAAGHGIGVTTDLPAYGTHPIRILAGAQGKPGHVLRLPLHTAWIPGHFAEKAIRATALRLRDFLNGRGALVEEGAESAKEHAEKG